MKITNIVRLFPAILPLFSGCASAPVAVSPIGPEPASKAAYVSRGYIQVFSNTEDHPDGDGPHYYPHMSYSIYDEAGHQVKYVPNHIGSMDETPSLVRIDSGNYNVVAPSSGYGLVTVPVVIRAGKTTVLHLDRGWRPATNISSNALVRLPDGEAVGWSSAVTAPTK